MVSTNFSCANQWSLLSCDNAWVESSYSRLFHEFSAIICWCTLYVILDSLQANSPFLPMWSWAFDAWIQYPLIKKVTKTLLVLQETEWCILHQLHIMRKQTVARSSTKQQKYQLGIYNRNLIMQCPWLSLNQHSHKD